MLAFHGFGDNMQNFQYTSLHAAWPDAIVVYFQGLVTRRGLPGWQVERGDDRDLELVDAALRSLRETYRIDDDRIYATGYSNGGDVHLPPLGGASGGVRRLRPGGRTSPSLGAADRGPTRACTSAGSAIGWSASRISRLRSRSPVR